MDRLKLIQSAQALYSNSCFRGIAEAALVPNSFLLKYHFKGEFKDTVVFTIVVVSENSIDIVDWIKEDWTKNIKTKLINYFGILGFKVFEK